MPDDVTAVTDASGNYTIDGLWSGGKTVTATMPEYTFNGPFTVVLPPNQTVDFEASQKTYSIAGTVYDYEDNPLGLVTVTAGAYSALTIDPTVVPAQGGQFTIQPVPAGTYTVTPGLNDLTFNPASQSVTVNETDGNTSGLVFRQVFVPDPTDHDRPGDGHGAASVVDRVHRDGSRPGGRPHRGHPCAGQRDRRLDRADHR